MGFELDKDYIEVPERMREFFEKYPTGSFQTVEVRMMTTSTGKDFVAYFAAAYRTPDDPTPGHGVAWEPVPGTTPYTKNSELMNAETSAWGRAIIAIGASTSKRIASANEIRNRQAEREAPDDSEASPAFQESTGLASVKQMNTLRRLLAQQGITDNEAVHLFAGKALGMQVDSLKHLTEGQISKVIGLAEAA